MQFQLDVNVSTPLLDALPQAPMGMETLKRFRSCTTSTEQELICVRSAVVKRITFIQKT